VKKEYETVIGVEVHVELATQTKIFCGCSTAFGAPPNTQVCPVCLGMPGTLPKLNHRVTELAMAVGLALHCEVSRVTRFDRKNYFYPDNPQNYQISQLYFPICKNGWLEIGEGQEKKRIRIHELHLEEDAGKLFHGEDGETLVDYNRAGVPLIEIVTEPDLRSAEETIAFVSQLRTTIGYLGASDCKLQEGSMRVDVNLSLREAEEERLGTRTEMKNLNSFRSITRAISAERERQQALLDAGERVIQETRRWDDAKGCSVSMRSKEDAQDYRYFPDPDLPPVYISEAWIQEVRDKQPELREDKQKRFVNEYGLPEYDAKLLTESVHLAHLFEQTAAQGVSPKKVSNWLMGEGLRLLREKEMDPEDVKLSPEHFAALLRLNETKQISNAVAKQVFEVVFVEDMDPREYVENHGLLTVQDEGLLRETVQRVINENAKSVEDYRNGKERALGYLVGQTMKAMRGQAEALAVTALLKEFLD
jgi:aspartyl-tRNA(Asn)/glutamyl-tRNA(Gln) amidotransferase subunit B